MLNEKVEEILTERLVNRIEQLNTTLLTTIGNTVKRIGTMTPSQARQLQNILKYGGDFDKVVLKLQQVTGLNIKDIYNIFDEVAKINLEFAKQFYEYKGIGYIPYSENLLLQNQVRSLANVTAQQYINFSNTSVLGITTKDINGNIIFKDLTTTYRDTIDKSVLSVIQGKQTYYEAMKDTLNEIGTSDIKVVDYATGKTRRLDSAVRMNIRDGIRSVVIETQKQLGKEFGADGIEISVHDNPAPDHEDIQGKQFSNEEFYNLQNELPFKDYQGRSYQAIERAIGEHNCYHYIFSIVLGVSKPNYSDDQLQAIKEANSKGFLLYGKNYTNYEGTQLQRALETKIRELKEAQTIFKASGDKKTTSEYQKSINQALKKYQELSKISGLPTKLERLR